MFSTTRAGTDALIEHLQRDHREVARRLGAAAARGQPIPWGSAIDQQHRQRVAAREARADRIRAAGAGWQPTKPPPPVREVDVLSVDELIDLALAAEAAGERVRAEELMVHAHAAEQRAARTRTPTGPEQASASVSAPRGTIRRVHGRDDDGRVPPKS